MEGPKVEEQPEKDGGHGGLSFFHGQGRALRLYGGVRNRFVRIAVNDVVGERREWWECRSHHTGRSFIADAKSAPVQFSNVEKPSEARDAGPIATSRMPSGNPSRPH
mmetsp:Transcript_24722/g.55922  ORF Transcript_24722/g.55922 Transcript_24722/m.55922 type:complete len:107 (+) Transcript_24722:204-524(+)